MNVQTYRKLYSYLRGYSTLEAKKKNNKFLGGAKNCILTKSKEIDAGVKLLLYARWCKKS